MMEASAQRVPLRTKLGLVARAVAGLFNDTSAQIAVAGLFPGALGSPPKRGTADFLRAYSTTPWLRAIANKVGTSLASVQWKLFALKNQRGKFMRDPYLDSAPWNVRTKMLARYRKQGHLVEIEEHPLLELINDPNPMMIGLNSRKLTAIYIDLVGEAYWLLQRNGARTPVKYWPIPPSWVKSIPTFESDEYKLQFGGREIKVPSSEIIRFNDPDPSDPYGRGSGVAQSLADELDVDEYASKYTKAFFFNRARPDLFIYGKDLDPEEARRVGRDPDQGAGPEPAQHRAQGPSSVRTGHDRTGLGRAA
jgi:hypothetical protein